MSICLATSGRPADWSFEATRFRQRCLWLSGFNGHIVMPKGPMSLGSNVSTPVELVDVPMGASRTDIGNALSDHLRHFAATHKPSVIHCVGLPAAAGALFGTRGRVPIVVEPGATAAQRPQVHCSTGWRRRTRSYSAPTVLSRGRH